jgi:hypothetical protein
LRSFPSGQLHSIFLNFETIFVHLGQFVMNLMATNSPVIIRIVRLDDQHVTFNQVQEVMKIVGALGVRV